MCYLGKVAQIRAKKVQRSPAYLSISNVMLAVSNITDPFLCCRSECLRLHENSVQETC